jgi:hypothetical protein
LRLFRTETSSSEHHDWDSFLLSRLSGRTRLRALSTVRSKLAVGSDDAIRSLGL